MLFLPADQVHIPASRNMELVFPIHQRERMQAAAADYNQAVGCEAVQVAGWCRLPFMGECSGIEVLRSLAWSEAVFQSVVMFTNPAEN